MDIKNSNVKSVLLTAVLVAFVGVGYLVFPSFAAESNESLKTGYWSDASIWSTGSVPDSNSEVVIKANHKVVYDVGSSRIAGATIQEGAELRFNPEADAKLESTANVVVNGRLAMKPANADIDHELRFVNVDESAFIGKGFTTPPLESPKPFDSDVGLWVMRNGYLDIHGHAKNAWLFAAESLNAGANSFSLRETPNGWRVGDRIAISPTDSPNSNNWYSQFEERTITALNDKTVTLDSALQYNHPKVNGMWGAEILNLTRNVKIGGTDSGRSHILVNSTQKQSIQYAAIDRNGPRFLGEAVDGTGRYGLHFHHSGDGSTGSIVRGTLITKTDNHAYVPHLSHGILFEDTVAYDVRQDAYWWDQCFQCAGDATNNTIFDHTVAALVRPDVSYRGYRLTGYAVGTGENNTIKNSVAVGVQGNKDASGFTWPETGTGHVWGFSENNIAHNNKVDGIFTWQNTGVVHTVEDFAAYHNGEFGIDHGAYKNPYVYSDSWLYGNGRGGIALRAVSTSNDRGEILSFERIIIDGAGISDHGISALEHSLTPSTATRLVDIEFRNVNQEPLHISERNRDGLTKFEAGAVRTDNKQPIDWVDITRPVWQTDRPLAVLEAGVHQDAKLNIINSQGNVLESLTYTNSSQQSQTSSIGTPFLNIVVNPLTPLVVQAVADEPIDTGGITPDPEPEPEPDPVVITLSGQSDCNGITVLTLSNDADSSRHSDMTYRVSVDSGSPQEIGVTGASQDIKNQITAEYGSDDKIDFEALLDEAGTVIASDTLTLVKPATCDEPEPEPEPEPNPNATVDLSGIASCEGVTSLTVSNNLANDEFTDYLYIFALNDQTVGSEQVSSSSQTATPLVGAQFGDDSFIKTGVNLQFKPTNQLLISDALTFNKSSECDPPEPEPEPTLTGDVNANGNINTGDFVFLKKYYKSGETVDASIDYVGNDRKITKADLDYWVSEWGK